MRNRRRHVFKPFFFVPFIQPHLSLSLSLSIDFFVLLFRTVFILSSIAPVTQVNPRIMTHPNEEHNQMKALKTPNEMHGFVVDVECGIPTSCPCGGRIINEVSRDPKYRTDFDTLPGTKYFTCINFEVINVFFWVLCADFDTFWFYV